MTCSFIDTSCFSIVGMNVPYVNKDGRNEEKKKIGWVGLGWKEEVRGLVYRFSKY